MDCLRTSDKFSEQSTFSKDDHWFFNRQREQFDKGETFSGIDFETGLQAVKALKEAFPNHNLAVLALKWIFMFDAVSCVIPGTSKVEQVLFNIQEENSPALSSEDMKPLNPYILNT